MATFVAGPAAGLKVVIDSQGRTITGELPADVADDVSQDAVTLLNYEQNRTITYGEHEVFLETLAPPQDVLVFGAVHIAQWLATFAGQMGYRPTVADSRPLFASQERFPDAKVVVGQPDELVAQIPFDRRSWVVVLSHEKRLEDPILQAALRSEARYIGAMGSRRTHALRVERLKEAGFGEEDVARIHGPVGLDIGAESPQEVAVSILAEMTQVRYGHGTGMPLRGVEGRVHKQRPEETGEVVAS